MTSVLIVGGGGREHALAFALAKSPKVSTIYIAPGNGGTSKHNKCQNVAISELETQKLIAFSKDNNVSVMVVGPEVPLANGLANACQEAGVLCFGPVKEAAMLESSKAFSKDFMAKYNIPTARYEVFTDYEKAVAHVEKVDYRVVLKASGLAAGKGVVLPNSLEEAKQSLKEIMVDKLFGSAGDQVVIEEFLEGEEVSVFAVSDGQTVRLLAPAQDHKRAYDNDEGPNTGGMGAYAPAGVVTEEQLQEINEQVIKPTIDGLRQEGISYVGILYAGLMFNHSTKRASTLEFNCRFGDPEAQVILPLLDTDFYDVVYACATQSLDKLPIEMKKDSYAVTVVAASAGYPGDYPKGKAISGIENAQTIENTFVFHAGTKLVEGQLVTSGGRVLAVTALGVGLQQAIDLAYTALKEIHFEGMQFRTDIGKKGLATLK